MEGIAGKVALVTGASRGIGLAVACKLAHLGAYVVGTATSESGLQNFYNYLEDHGLHGTGMVLDVTRPDNIEIMINKLNTEDKVPLILVNNAGITADNLLLRMEDDEWFKVIDTNLNAVFRVTKACLKAMFKARFGRIINIGSVVAASGNSGQCNYTAAKAGLVGFSKSLAHEMGSRGITVNVVAPGFIDTDMTKNLPDLVKTEMIKRIPLRSLGETSDIANTVAFLASDYGRYITGQTIHVNGGLYMD